MSFKEKNITVSLVSFTLILIFYLIRLFQMYQNETFVAENVFRLWGIIIVAAIIVTVVVTVFTHLIIAIVESIKTGNHDPDIDDIEDERDKLIDLRGTKVAYTLHSIGVFLAMLTFVFGQPPLIMFSLIILSGLVAQIMGDVSRLMLYQGGVR